MNKIGVILKINIKLIILIWNRFGAKNCTLLTTYDPFEVDLKSDYVKIIGAVIYAFNKVSCI